jgi:hypothetical protein
MLVRRIGAICCKEKKSYSAGVQKPSSEYKVEKSLNQKDTKVVS